MSVICYGDEKFQQIFSSLESGGSRWGCIFGYPEGWQKDGGLLHAFSTFCQDLQRANISTWNRQYPYDKAEVRVATLLKYKSPLSDIALYKSLRGLRYNLADNAGGESDLLGCLKRLNNLLDELALEIISKLPEYDKAETW